MAAVNSAWVPFGPLILSSRASTSAFIFSFICKIFTARPASDETTLTREPLPSKRVKRHFSDVKSESAALWLETHSCRRREWSLHRLWAQEFDLLQIYRDEEAMLPADIWCHAHRRFASRCVCQSASSSPSSCARARCPCTQRSPRPRHRRRDGCARWLAPHKPQRSSPTPRRSRTRPRTFGSFCSASCSGSCSRRCSSRWSSSQTLSSKCAIALASEPRGERLDPSS